MWSLLRILCVAEIVIAFPISKTNVELPLVTIAQGTVSGLVADDGENFEFYGIPYADSTAGSHRFKAPLPPPIFTETFVANRMDIKCVRPLGVAFEGTEDCLVADVFTPTLDNESKLPVMVWVKGREFKTHEKELSFKKFVDEDVVVVTLNFRESILGYLCLGTEIAPGNAGLKDIIAGLKWVKANIEQFGGDPDEITLIGHGSGAAAVDLITLSPMANGLVHRAIAQSGNALAPWAVSRDNLEYAVQVAEALGHTITNVKDLSELFTRVSVPSLMGVINELDLTDNSFAFAPCVENEKLSDVEPFLVKTPFKIITEGEFSPIPFITGFVDKEGTIRAKEISDSTWLKRMDESFAEFLQADLAAHSEELAYLFYEVPLISESDEIPEMDLTITDILIERWTNFAKTGYPTSFTSELIWQPFNNKTPRYLRILRADEEKAARKIESDSLDPHSELKAFWDEIYEEHFLDAQSNWNLQVKDDDHDDDLIEEHATSSPDDNELDSSTTPLPDEGDPDSASTAVGYTFLIISAYALLNQFHLSQLLL